MTMSAEEFASRLDQLGTGRREANQAIAGDIKSLADHIAQQQQKDDQTTTQLTEINRRLALLGNSLPRLQSIDRLTTANASSGTHLRHREAQSFLPAEWKIRLWKGNIPRLQGGAEDIPHCFRGQWRHRL